METTLPSLRGTLDYTPASVRERVADPPAGTTTDELATKVFLATIAYVVIFVVAAVLLVA